MAAESYYQVLTVAVNDLLAHGYDSAERVAYWQDRLARAAETGLTDVGVLDRQLRATLEQTWARFVDGSGLISTHPGASRYTVQKLRPQLRDELTRRLAASRNLIVLNRDEAIARQARRFAGWATALPPGPTPEADRRKVKGTIRKSLASLPFAERRVAIDQGHKMTAALSATVALTGGAIAARWRHVHQTGYDARPEHLARDGVVYLVRGSWALQRGLIAANDNGYVDELPDQPAELVYCRCQWVWLYHLRQLPADLLTERGRSELARVAA
jgi:hypothetical protein